MKIGVIGIGKLGLSFALLCEKKGFDVIGSDISEDYINLIKTKKINVSEPGINELIKNYENFEVTTDNLKVINDSDITFIFVQTPSLSNGEYDHSNIESIIDEIKNNINNYNLFGKTIVVGCTTMPNYCETVQDRLHDFGISVLYNPEFIAQGEILNGLEFADMVLIGGNNEDSIKKIKEVYVKIMSHEPVFNVMSLTSSEITKISINCFLTTKISFANMIGQICEKTGVGYEVDKILKSIGDDSRIGNKYLKFGFGFGGPCLPRDNRALGSHMEKIKIENNIPFQIDRFNISHQNFITDMIISKNKNLLPFIFDNISYKKNTNIITESQQLKVIHQLLDLGYKVHISDNSEILQKIKNDLIESYGNLISFGDSESINGFKVQF
jgi:nucleotide sugar dehydrogenase